MIIKYNEQSGERQRCKHQETVPTQFDGRNDTER